MILIFNIFLSNQSPYHIAQILWTSVPNNVLGYNIEFYLWFSQTSCYCLRIVPFVVHIYWTPFLIFFPPFFLVDFLQSSTCTVEHTYKSDISLNQNLAPKIPTYRRAYSIHHFGQKLKLSFYYVPNNCTSLILQKTGFTSILLEVCKSKNCGMSM
jgi:hypothetical protein